MFSEHPADIFTKGLGKYQNSHLMSKLEMKNIFISPSLKGGYWRIQQGNCKELNVNVKSLLISPPVKLVKDSVSRLWMDFFRGYFHLCKSVSSQMYIRVDTYEL